MRYNGRTLVTQPSTSGWGRPASAGIGVVEGYGVGSGGTSSSITSGGKSYTLLTFSSDGTFTVASAGIFDFILVGGGGCGGYRYNSTSINPGGGGGGGVLQSSAYFDVGTYSVVVGAGGALGPWEGYGSSIGSICAVAGGGRGACYGGHGAERQNASKGGSGGGGAGTDVTTGGLSFNNGVTGYDGSGGGSSGGGGGGAGAAGTVANGGNGRDISTWLGQSAGTTIRGGGGGGSGWSTAAGGTGGTGGGGTGGNGAGTNGTNGTANTGGGGGAPTGTGGSGIVYIRFRV